MFYVLNLEGERVVSIEVADKPTNDDWKEWECVSTAGKLCGVRSKRTAEIVKFGKVFYKHVEGD